MKPPSLLSEHRCLTITILTAVLITIYLEFRMWTAYLESQGPLPVHLNASQIPWPPNAKLDVKWLMLDTGNCYVHNPVSVFLYEGIGSTGIFQVITANVVSVCSVFVAVFSARFLSNDSLNVRRLGVLLFEVRNFFDALDGTIARNRPKVNDKTTSEAQSKLGYYVDGLCDGIGTILLLHACITYLKRQTKGSYYHHGREPTVLTDRWTFSKTLQNHRPKWCRTSQLPVVLGIQWLVSSVCWNRYISALTQILQVEADTPAGVGVLKGDFARQPLVCLTFLFWRLFNVHAGMEILLIAIFTDRLVDFLIIMYFVGWAVLFISVMFGEMVLAEASFRV